MFHYTTTSIFSPTRLRNGFAFSYQSTTEDARHWEIQRSDSEGKWAPLIGYGMNPSALHLGTFCVKQRGDEPGDYFVSARYYNQNNRGFGSLWRSDLSKTGINTYDNQSWLVRTPQQHGAEQMTLGIVNDDDPSPKIDGEYVGKASSPRCARPDELYFSYTFTSANGRIPDAEGNKHMYSPFIAFRPNLESFHPLDTPSYEKETGILRVIEDSSHQYALLWPTPVLSWKERSGDRIQQFSPRVASQKGAGITGLPVATVGTSSLYNTDRKPFECYLGFEAGGAPYSPNSYFMNKQSEEDKLYRNQDGLTIVKDRRDFCKYLTPSDVLGVAIQMTSNRLDIYDPDYVVGEDKDNGQKSSKRRETARLLGVIDVRGQQDTSFQAHVPSNVPFELHLLDREYGLKLTDVRSWHSLKTHEVRTDCGGCHAHEEGKALPFRGTVASKSAPTDVVTETPFLTYDATCRPTLQHTEQPTQELPEWNADIWPQFDEYCSSCHHSEISDNSEALLALSYTDEQSAYNMLLGRNYVHQRSGALGSAAFWAARGERTDGRDNALAVYQPNYSQQQWGYRYSSIHKEAVDLCDGSDEEAAQWVYRLGLWIDNHAPRDVGLEYPTKFDRYHPTVHANVSGEGCNPDTLHIGAWDDSGTLAMIEVYQDSELIATFHDVPNGVQKVTLKGKRDAESLRVYAYDAAGNRQEHVDSLAAITRDCMVQRSDDQSPPPEKALNLQPHYQEVAPGQRFTFALFNDSADESDSIEAKLLCKVHEDPRISSRLGARIADLPPWSLDGRLEISFQLPPKTDLSGKKIECFFYDERNALRSNTVTVSIQEKRGGKKVKKRYRRMKSWLRRAKQRCALSPDDSKSCQMFHRLQQPLMIGRMAFR
jgi:hypothetical protein